MFSACKGTVKVSESRLQAAGVDEILSG